MFINANDIKYKVINHGHYFRKEAEQVVMVTCPECGFKHGRDAYEIRKKFQENQCIECSHCHCRYTIELKPEVTPRPD